MIAWSLSGQDLQERAPSSGQPSKYSHGAGHRVLQLIQEALHAGPHILQPPASVSLWLLLHERPCFAPQETVILRDAIKGTQGTGQWGARFCFILEKRRQSDCSSLRPPGTQRLTRGLD